MTKERMARVLVTVTDDAWSNILETARSCPEPDETPEDTAERWLLEEVQGELQIDSRFSPGVDRWFKLTFEEWE